jgi:probable HAF family extracellular repeat protein
MKNSRLSLYVVGLLLLFAAAATAADTPALKFRFAEANAPDATSTEPSGLTDDGLISSGLYVDNAGIQHGYLLKLRPVFLQPPGNGLLILDDPNGKPGTTAAGKVNGGSVVGSYTSSTTGNSVGFLYGLGGYTDIPGPSGAVNTYGSGINDKGAIVGYYTDAAGATHGFLLKGTKYTTLDVPGATASYATDINKSGKIVLFWANSRGAIKSSLYNGKTYRRIDVPGAASSYALGLNTAGDICYGWLDSSGVVHGALLHRGTYYKFDHPNSTATYGGGIDGRHIIGGYQTSSSGTNWFGFKATYK